MNFNSQFVKFISIIYNPKKYPLPKKKIVQILMGLFKNKNDRKLIFTNFTFSSKHYYINNVNGVFEPIKLSKIISNAIIKAKKPNEIWAFSIDYNDFDDKDAFINETSKFINTSTEKGQFTNFLVEEINKLKQPIIHKANYYDLNNLKSDFKTHEKLALVGWELERIMNKPLANILELLSVTNKGEWHNTISKIDNPLVANVLNLYYMQTKNANYKILSKILPNSTEGTISLAILNAFEIINQKSQNNNSIHQVAKFLLDNLSKLNLKRYYWYGIILSNAEYFIRNNSEAVLYIEKRIKKEIIKNICDIKCKHIALKYLKQGLKNIPRDTSYKHLDIWQSIIKTDKSFALILMQEILDDYKKIIKNEQCYLSLIQHNGIQDNNVIDYTKNLINAITGLTLNNKIDIIKLIDEFLNNFHLTEEDYLYNSSKMISERRKVLHLFLVIFFVIENLITKKFKIDGLTVNNYFDKFLKYINLHIWHEDDELTNSIDKIFKLEISIENGTLYKEIDLLFDMPIPPFKSLAILINKVPENVKTKKIKYFIEEYFDKYYKYWIKSKVISKKVKMKKWFEICMIIKDKNRAQICAETFPEYEKLECLSKIASMH